MLALSLSMIAAGVAFGAPIPFHADASNPGADRGNIRQYAGPRRSGHGQRPQVASPDWTDRRRHGDDEGLDLSAEQIRESCRRTAIGHVNEIEAGHQFSEARPPHASAFRRRARQY